MLEAGDAVMADKGFLIRDLLTLKKVHLVSPAYCREPCLSVKGTTHTRCVASLHTHVERNILKLKQFRILFGVVPLLLKPMLDRIIAALTNLCKRSIRYKVHIAKTKIFYFLMLSVFLHITLGSLFCVIIDTMKSLQKERRTI